MVSNEPTFLLVGSAPYSNRGCEAIIRGTVKILGKEFGQDCRFIIGFFGSPRAVAKQEKHEYDARIVHVALRPSFGSLNWWLKNIRRRLGNRSFEPSALKPYLPIATAALEIGGDNYSLDYVNPLKFVEMDRYLQQRKIPIVLWAASVGPFDRQPKTERIMFEHLPTLTGVFVREPWSLDYLVKHGMHQNVHRVVDPAFLLEAEEPKDPEVRAILSEGAIGLNLSPLLAKYVTAGNEEAWENTAAKLLLSLYNTLHQPILLIPHVTSSDPSYCDYQFMQRVLNRLSNERCQRIHLLKSDLNAAQTKGIIARCQIFAGARTHATIASISSGVPTLSLGYSIKAKGLNQDVFESEKYHLSSLEITPENVTAKMKEISEEAQEIRQYLSVKIPEIKQQAEAMGSLLRTLLKL